MQQTITSRNGMTLAYAEYGDRDGFPILVQHGLIASIDDFDLFQRLIEHHARLVCIARPGYGRSTPYLMESYAEWAEIVAPLVTELGLTSFDVLGMSSGAPYAYALGYGFAGKARNLYIFSGMPALYDETVLSRWPFGVIENLEMPHLEDLAWQWFFQNVQTTDALSNDVRDSTMHHAFGVAQDLRLRYLDWGFRLDQVKSKVYMRHSKEDDAVPYETALRTAQLLPNCELDLLESGPHFSAAALDDFIRQIIVPRLPSVNAGRC